MKLVGIVGRAYYNRDGQEIIQVNEAIRKILANYSGVVSILLLPTNYKRYVDMEMGEDKIEEFDRKKLDYILEKCDGFIVPGGTYWYRFDEYVMKYAIDSGKPLLGICAGFQAMCSMYAMNRQKFDMTKRFAHDRHYKNPNQYVHENVVVYNTLLMKILGRDKIMVNSLHHDYIDFDMFDLVISSLSDDGIIEAIELPEHSFFLGIQWHPEYLVDINSKKIFDYFIKCIS